MFGFRNWSSKKKEIVFFALIFGIGLFLRIFRLGYDDLWFDEVQTIIRADTITRVSTTFGPPLYYFIFHFWLKFCGKSEFAIRFPSFIFGVFSLWGMRKLTQYVWERKISIISVAVLTISPFHIWYCQEARHYALSVLLFIYTFYFFLKALNENHISNWLFFTIGSILGIYCDYYFFLLFFPEFLTIVIKKEKTLFHRWFRCKMIILLAFLPWLSNFIKNIKFVANRFWPMPADLKSLLITLENFTLGYTATPTLFHFSFLLVSLIIGITFLEFKNSRKVNEGCVFAGLFWVIPVLIVFLIAQFYNIYFSRVLIIFSIPYYLVLSYGINICLKKKLHIIVIFLLILSFHSLANYYIRISPSPIEYHVGTYVKKPVRPLVEYIKNNIKPGDIVIHTNVQTLSVFEFYGGEAWKYLSYYLISPREDLYWKMVSSDYCAQKRTDYKSIIRVGEEEHLRFKRIWLVLSSWARDGTLDDNSLFVRQYMEKKYKKILKKWYQGILLELYEKE